MERIPVWLSAGCLFLAACSGGGGGGTNSPPTSVSPPPPPPPAATDTTFDSLSQTGRFLDRATFGADPDAVTNTTGTSASDWIRAEFAKPASLNLPFTSQHLNDPTYFDADGSISFVNRNGPTISFWRNAVEADDQLRQRMAFALSQIFVVSGSETTSSLAEYPEIIAHYQDILTTNAFGNYRDLLEEITYSPAMGIYLTYWQNQPADPTTGRMPDENYAREIMQLFTIGLVELNMDGTEKTDATGNAIETYDIDDVTGLAKVFTGLSLAGNNFFAGPFTAPTSAYTSPMQMFEAFHSKSEKSFLGTTIAANTPGNESIDLALDTLFNHPNTAPFFSRQLIQRLVTSNPSPDYVRRVANSFESGSYTLPDGSQVGTGQRGDLQATLSAVLFDAQALSETSRNDPQFGKLREPVLRFTHWARAFDAGEVKPEVMGVLWNTGSPELLAQAPYKAPSVFNYYRPNYVPPATLSGDAGMTVPELQITNSSTLVGYANTMTFFIFGFADYSNVARERGVFIPDYSDELALANDPAALVDHLDQVMTHGNLKATTKSDIIALLEALPLTDDPNNDHDGPKLRVHYALSMIMSSPEYLVQR